MLEFLPFDGYPFARVQDVSTLTEAVGNLVKDPTSPGPSHTVPAYWFNGTVDALPTLSPFASA